MIELIAMITMLIDHVGITLFEDHFLFRIIGRIAFPLYAFGVAMGFKYTSNIKTYLYRLLLIAVVSQVPFMFALNQIKLNVIFTFIFALFCLYLIKNSKKHVSLPLTLIIMVLCHFISDYGSYGISLVLMFYYLQGSKLFISHLLLNVIYFFLFGYILQIFSLLGTLIILNKDKLKKIKINKTFYRSFYPAHLTALFIVGLML